MAHRPCHAAGQAARRGVVGSRLAFLLLLLLAWCAPQQAAVVQPSHVLPLRTITSDAVTVVTWTNYAYRRPSTPGDGVRADGRPPGDTQQDPSQAVAGPPQADDLVRVLEGRTYYLLEDNLTCRAYTPGRPRIKSWKNKLTFTRGQVLLWQTLCNDNPMVLDFTASAFEFAPDLASLTYQHDMYTYYAQPPQLCAQGHWCPVEEPQAPNVQGREDPTHDDTQDTSKAQE